MADRASRNAEGGKAFNPPTSKASKSKETASATGPLVLCGSLRESRLAWRCDEVTTPWEPVRRLGCPAAFAFAPEAELGGTLRWAVAMASLGALGLKLTCCGFRILREKRKTYKNASQMA